MIEADSNHCRIVARSLAGKRRVDEQTFASLAILGERLERVKALNEAFAGVRFSAAVEELRTSKAALAIG
ncbi:MAG: hypothetical protein JXN61_03525 [Sedimentisphaerales bacterium]|nr:hypothetical protein [Sedimentisphaerales bacterium]